MSLDLKKLGVRSASAAVFVCVLLAGILINYYTFTLLFLVVALLGLIEFFRLSGLMGAKPFKTWGIICGLIMYAAFIRFDAMAGTLYLHPQIKIGLVAIPFLVFAVALFSERERPMLDAAYTIAGILYVVLPFALLHELVIMPGILTHTPIFFPNLLLGIIFLIWSNDTFAYLGGSLLGRHKVMERVSPGKTWEGTVCGILATVVISFFVRRWMFPESVTLFWPMLGLIVPVIATTGDLVESALKREAGVKDSGSLMPGHGGILDRFDSLIFVSPFVVVMLKLL
jgi:phosphatidate cytidylyltransferase